MKKHLKLCVALIVVAAILMSLAAFLIYWFCGDRYEDFEDFNKEFAIPGLDEGFIPQGMGNYTNSDSSSSSDTVFLVSGYMNKGGASRIYVIEGGESIGYVTVMLDEETTYEGHASGVATDGMRVWLCSDGTVYAMAYDDVVAAAAENGTVTITGSFDAYNEASFCYYDGTYFYVGEFYREGNYETDEIHHITTDAGDENKAVIMRFTASTSATSTTGVSSTTPGRAYSITGLIQGMAITSGSSSSTTYITLSQSYGLSNSHLLTYKFTTSSVNSSTITFYSTDGSESKALTTYQLDSSCLVNDYEIPSMSEGLCTVNNKVYVLFESAGAKYKMFVRERLSNVYSIRINGDNF
ncbi:MAG: hypothetical protein LUF82_02220 [Clostridia bacterium]|nr:hypothetical protein [Clostridia bacterium]